MIQDPAEALRREADGLRDRRDWLRAAAAYAAFLELRPEDAGMRVQQAHCLKEAGRVGEALAFYRAAAAQRPGEADIALQIGHAEKLRGEAAAALEAYGRAVLLDPAAAAPWAEWRALAETARRPAPAAGGVVLDLTDLVAWVRGGRRAPSGIQRVQLGIADAALAHPALAAAASAGAAPPRLCAMPAEGGGWRDLPAPLFRRLDHLMTQGAGMEAPDWHEAVAVLNQRMQAPPLRFARDEAGEAAVLVTLGGTWGVEDYLDQLRLARQRDGLRHVPLLHDCVPLLLPEHCTEGTVRGYAHWFSNLALHADGVLAVSRSTAADLGRLHAALLPEIPAPPVAVVPLDAAPRPVAGAAPDHPLLRGGRPFVLFVSTIEGRKNHLMVFQAWLTLARRLGAAAVPQLVCVGRPGWRAEAALDLLAHAPELRDKVRILSDVPDPLLAALYRACLFTLYNSHHEGWGLPVTESLAAGKVALVPAHSGLLEAGEGGAVFFAPGHESDLLDKLTRLITDPACRAAAEAAIAAAPPRRGWAALAGQLLAEARRLAAEAEERVPLALLPLETGRRHPLRNGAPRPGLEAAVAEAVRDGGGWRGLEPWGAWTRPGTAGLTLPLAPEVGGAALRLELDLRAPGEAPREVEILAWRGARAAAPVRLSLAAGAEAVVALRLPSGEGAEEAALRVEITAAGPAIEGARPIGIGVTGFALAREDDPAGRLALLEGRRFRRALPIPA
ncbi:glycosyltransferase family 1 protein [Roseomonas sp. KE0001]|uniref:glycosyltransferase family 4 protein n=1 Tax=Roseomonas sp. KE0001 TaxID=2479201 RepID=UPI0018E016C5|nr:glycosyltransferase family 1 protein [Roseomonas sp. KE0001]MBI0433043.1 glycosyltransferase family 1 protein [Roseomonas sp. KE0001]